VGAAEAVQCVRAPLFPPTVQRPDVLSRSAVGARRQSAGRPSRRERGALPAVLRRAPPRRPAPALAPPRSPPGGLSIFRKPVSVRRASVPIPKFAQPCSTTDAKLRNRRTLATL